eukprot:gene9100-6393_t
MLVRARLSYFLFTSIEEGKRKKKGYKYQPTAFPSLRILKNNQPVLPVIQH